MFRSIAALVLTTSFLAGCVSTDYAGNSYAPTEQVDVYFSPDEVDREYTVMGKARSAADESVQFKTIEADMVKTAMANGADGLIFQDIRIETVGQTSTTTGRSDYTPYYYRGGRRHNRYAEGPGGSGTWYADSSTTEIRDKVVIAELIKYK